MNILEVINEFLDRRYERKLSLIRAKSECRQCERLSNLLEAERRERLKMYEAYNTPKPVEENAPGEMIPLKTYIPWSKRRAQLEAQSRELANQTRTEPDNDL